MNTTEMTMRKFFEAVIAIDNAPADVVAKAESEIAKMDAASASPSPPRPLWRMSLSRLTLSTC